MNTQICNIMTDTVIYSGTKFVLDALISDKNLKIHKLQFVDAVIYAITDGVYTIGMNQLNQPFPMYKDMDLAKPLFLILGVSLGDYLAGKDRTFIENIVTVGTSQVMISIVDKIRNSVK